MNRWLSLGGTTMGFELNYGDIGILFFLTLGPLKAILPFARVTRWTEPAFRRTVAWQAIATATAIVLGVALLGPVVLPNWHVSPPAIAISAPRSPTFCRFSTPGRAFHNPNTRLPLSGAACSS
jgi:hypothetical protein